ncbi:unnamed protein product [Paramecium pentaurelia]|uniref:Uncharacterized protein n=1 Tax=Paramecium pentaurelia TaxID=43138 RepID=A0A8S1TY26_9CILI|nr:unnamed protein product [Paramecium pentaurelia]
MISQSQNKKFCIEPIIPTDNEVYKWALINHRFQKVKIQERIDQNQIVYLFEGRTLRSLSRQNQPDYNDKIFYNLEQIMKLEWKGEQGTNNKKFGKWKAFWNQRRLQNVEGYYENGSKIGLWNELFKNYFSQAKVFETGQYQNNYRVGKWKYIYKKAEIGGGKYSNEMHNMKIGQWIELDDEFRNQKQVIYNGEYNCGNKVGSWDICFRQDEINKFTIIGGGQYDEKGNGLKNGLWIDLDEEFNCIKQVIMTGNYENGKKTGRWNIKYRLEINQSFSKIGGGQYNQEGIKIGRWIDLDEGFYFEKQVTYNGEYQNGIKVPDYNDKIFYNLEQIMKLEWKGEQGTNNKKFGKWKAFWNQRRLQNVEGYYENGSKIGLWNELFKNYFSQAKVFETGQYQNNYRVGKWKYIYKKAEIGGGKYSNEMHNMKIGQWIELDDEFRNQKQVIYNGEYNCGNKVGSWDICFRQDEINKFTIIGGGQYDEKGNGLKNGLWIDLDEEFNCIKQVIMTGNYENGKKTGRWNIKYRLEINQSFSKIGGGQYNQEGIKIGRWIDLDEGFYFEKQVTYNGEYQNGIKVGSWVINFRKDQNDEFKQIGGGEYNQEGIKIGQWVDLDNRFNIEKQVIYKGNYQNGVKVGPWVINFRKDQKVEFKQIILKWYQNWKMD